MSEFADRYDKPAWQGGPDPADQYDKPAWQGGPDPLAVAPKGAKKSQMTLDAEAAAASLRSAVEASTQPINEIAAALAKAQGAMENAALNKENPFFSSKYADLAAIRDAVMPHLAMNGIALAQTTEKLDGAFVLRTRLIHSSGQFIESVWPLPAPTEKVQAMGSALTYARRYSLASICGIAAEDDDDGNEANKTNGKAKAKPIEPALIDDLNAGIIRDLLKKTGTNEAAFCDWVSKGVLMIEHLPAEHVDRAIHALQAKLEKAKAHDTSEAST